MTTKLRFRRAQVTPAHFTETLPPAVTAPATPGVVTGSLGYEFPDRRRPEAHELRLLMKLEQVIAQEFLFGSKDERAKAGSDLGQIRYEILLHRLRLEGRP